MISSAESPSIDEVFWLSGDENCGVGLHCRTCDREGLPVAYYQGISTFYVNCEDVVTVHTIVGLIDAGEAHAASCHRKAA